MSRPVSRIAASTSFDQISRLGILSGSGGYLQDQRSLLFLSGLYDTLDDFHVVDIESTYCVVAVSMHSQTFSL